MAPLAPSEDGHVTIEMAGWPERGPFCSRFVSHQCLWQLRVPDSPFHKPFEARLDEDSAYVSAYVSELSMILELTTLLWKIAGAARAGNLARTCHVRPSIHPRADRQKATGRSHAADVKISGRYASIVFAGTLKRRRSARACVPFWIGRLLVLGPRLLVCMESQRWKY